MVLLKKWLWKASLSPLKNQNDTEVFMSSDSTIELSYKAQTAGIYTVEINDDTGLAVINIPIYPENVYPLLPNPLDLNGREVTDLGDNLNLLRSQMLSLVNEDRRKYGENIVAMDAKLNQLAQARSDDMAENNYFSHWDQQGRNANDLRKNYMISTFVAENIAKDVNLTLAEYGLMQSAAHRENILKEDWTRAGFGISKHNDGSYIFVQIFSEKEVDLNDLNGLRSEIQNAINLNRNTDINQTDQLNTLAQNWSELMATDDFFDFVSPNNGTLVDSIRNAGINASLGTFIVGNSSFQNALGQIQGNTQIQESRWKNLGIGIKQDTFGVIKITLIYTE